MLLIELSNVKKTNELKPEIAGAFFLTGGGGDIQGLRGEWLGEGILSSMAKNEMQALAHSLA